ncbi:MAG: hypothetical protein US15_C0020G0010 [Candidatus Moranbacteria bacterium GW2011_GWF1_36_4]|nr:MAG: hypothetical protein US15_C0020G0010 [Candidatus Moranbacteria bacterium GW2011_GWF1_36_4]
MIVIILLLALVTLFILFGFYEFNNSTKKSKIITLSIAVSISVWWIVLLVNEINFYLRNHLGFSIEYDLKDFIFDDHWFLSSLLFGSIAFFIFVLHNRISMYRRMNETQEQREQREEMEAKKIERAREKRRLNNDYLADQQRENQRLQTASTQSYTELKCPKCNSTNLTANNKGFGLGKAAVGGVLLGPVGLLGGLVGSKKAVFICLKCGNQFEK